MTKRLEGIRNKEAIESRRNAGISRGTDNAAAFETGFELGFNAAVNELWPEIENLVQSCRMLSKYPDSEMTFDHMIEALAAFRKATGDE